jgi:dolichol-phosphate mannosyltransferase
VSVILPTYNEKENVDKVIKEIIRNVFDLKEVIVVDDNSPDCTWDVVQNISKTDKRIKLIRRLDERGLTSAIWTGIMNAQGEYIAWMDCDMSMHPEVIPNLLSGLKDFDIVIGSRYVPGGKDIRPFFRRFVSKCLNIFAQAVLVIPIKDLTSGFVVAKRDVFRKVSLQGDYGEYCIRFLHEAFKKKYKIKEIPYVFTDRTDGKSKSEEGFFSFGWGYFKMILRLRNLDY